jgi:hypothetical protein
VAGTVRDHGLADKAEAPINGDVIFVTEAQDGNIEMRFAVGTVSNFVCGRA